MSARSGRMHTVGQGGLDHGSPVGLVNRECIGVSDWIHGYGLTLRLVSAVGVRRALEGRCQRGV